MQERQMAENETRMAAEVGVAARGVAKQAEQVRISAEEIKASAGAVEASTDYLTEAADRRTVLAANRTVLAAERTYAAWIRTGLMALASGIGARALIDQLPAWLAIASAASMIVFSVFCFITAAWRNLQSIAPPEPDVRTLPAALLLALAVLLAGLSLASLYGVLFWSTPRAG
jgi:putative membrane protein